jgi:hypothetical protein
MPEQRPGQSQQPVIVVQQSQQQTQEGCLGCGSGCGSFIAWILFACLLLFPFMLVTQAVQGEVSMWWLPVGIIGSLLVVGGVVAAVDQKLGLGLLDRLSRIAEPPQEAATRPAEDILGEDAANYGRAPDPPRMGRRVPHPDDPVPGPAGATTPEARDERQPSEPNVYEQIRRLAELRDEGLVTPEEFEAKKRDLLDRL